MPFRGNPPAAALAACREEAAVQPAMQAACGVAGAAQAQVADIGLMGCPAKKDGKAVEGVRIFLGGTIGENAALASEFEKVPSQPLVCCGPPQPLLHATSAC